MKAGKASFQTYNNLSANRLSNSFWTRGCGALLCVIGWILSPLTWWNDLLVNLPVSWLLASLIWPAQGPRFGFAVIFFYWLTNVAGLIMMISGGRLLATGKRIRANDIMISLWVCAGYTLIVLILSALNIVKPLGGWLRGS